MSNPWGQAWGTSWGAAWGAIESGDPVYYWTDFNWAPLSTAPKIYDGSQWVQVTGTLQTYDGTAWVY
jgi:hypothetical protein